MILRTSTTKSEFEGGLSELTCIAMQAFLVILTILEQQVFKIELLGQEEVSDRDVPIAIQIK